MKAKQRKQRTLTCPLPDDRAELGAEQNIHMVQDELHHHRLDPHLHEGGCATEAGRLDLLGPAKGHHGQEMRRGEAPAGLGLPTSGAAGPGAQAQTASGQFWG